MNKTNPPILLSLLFAVAASCSSDPGSDPNCDGFRCDDEDIEKSPCDGPQFVDESGRDLEGKIAGRLNDPVAKLVFRAGSDCPTTFEGIMNKLMAADKVEGEPSCSNRRTMLVSESAQAVGEATNYRSVTALDCDQPIPEGIVPPGFPNGGFGGSEAGILFSLFGLQAGGAMPANAEIIGFDKAAGVFNYYETDGTTINFMGNSSDFLKGKGEGNVRACARCHAGGGLIMKELQAPWLHWEGDTSTPGASEFIDRHADLLGGQSDGIDMENIVREGNRDWNKARVTNFRNLIGKEFESKERGDVNPVKELFRPLFCDVDFNLESATSSDNGSTEGVVGGASLSGVIFPRQLGFGSIDFDSEEYDGVIRANGQVLRGLNPENIETIFGLTTVASGEEDENYIVSLVGAGIIDDDFVESVLAVDFTRVIFSDDRCGLLDTVFDGITSMDPETLNPAGVRAAVLAQLEGASSGAATELKNNLANPNDDLRARVRSFAQACSDRTDTESITFTKDGSSQTLDVPSMLVDYMKIVSLNRVQAGTAGGTPCSFAREGDPCHPDIFEFPPTMPQDSQNVANGTRLHPESCTITRQFVGLATAFDAGATCFDRCGEVAPSGCSCAPDCGDNCCADFTDQCVVPDCDHDICSEGGALDSRCQDPAKPGNCVEQICAADDFCCTNTFDDSCVSAVTNVCGLSCEPEVVEFDSDNCCKTCGPKSKPCGDSCIANANNCARPDGCACNAQPVSRQ